MLIGRTGRSEAAPEAGFRFAGFRDPLPAALGFSPGLPDGCGRIELGLDVGLTLGAFTTGILPTGSLAAGVLSAGVLSAGILSAGVFAGRVAISASVDVERLRSPRVCPVR